MPRKSLLQFVGVSAARPGVLVFSDGTFFRGTLFGAAPAPAGSFGEAVFQTAMSGYQEILTDPSYRGQIVCFTYPSFGNYGVNPVDFESPRAWLSGVVVRDLCEVPSNFRATSTVDEFLREQKVAGITGVDTRAVVRKIRVGGAQTAGIFAAEGADIAELAKRVAAQPSMDGLNLVKDFDGKAANDFVAAYIKEKNINPSALTPIAVLDFGIKYNILRELIAQGFMPRVFAGDTPLASQKDFRAADYAGYFFSNGPGDPAVVESGIANIRQLVESGKPCLGICLGHQMISHALGAKTYKLKFGHHGGNQPVKADYRKQVIITSQNHGFAVDEESLRKVTAPGTRFEHNANDLSAEGFRLVDDKHKVLSVQYHPEAAPGPRDAAIVFTEFRALFAN
ncbi:MAG: glutamine-hydrolyzing carbamoyl-phosphate synthase small subunit [Turneriella sp.]